MTELTEQQAVALAEVDRAAAALRAWKETGNG